MAAVKQPKAGVTWERIEDGIYRREGREGKPIYRAVRQLGGKDPVTRRYPQEVRTFNGSKVKNALKEARLWRAEGAVEADKGPRSKNAAASMTLQEALDALHQAESYAPWTLQLHGYLWDALSKADPRLPSVKLKDLGTTQLRSALAKVPAASMRDKARKLVGTIYNHFEVTPNPATKPPARRTRSTHGRCRGEAEVPGRWRRRAPDYRNARAVPLAGPSTVADGAEARRGFGAPRR